MLSEDDDTNLRIPMKLDGVFSYFPTRALTHEAFENCEDMQTMDLTPDELNGVYTLRALLRPKTESWTSGEVCSTAQQNNTIS